MQEVDLSVQIVNYKTLKYLNPLLVSIEGDLADSKLNYEVLIVDNASGDDLSNIENKWQGRNVSAFYSEVNGGFGAGNNFLEKHAKGKYILLVNPDIHIIAKDTILRLISVLEQNNASVAGPRLMKIEDDSKELIGENKHLKMAPQLWDHGELTVTKDEEGNPQFISRDNTGNVAWVSGAFFLITKLAYESMDGFDEKFFLYKEEEDLCLRLRRAGNSVVYAANIEVLHYGSVVAGRLEEFFDESMAYFKQKHGDEDAV